MVTELLALDTQCCPNLLARLLRTKRLVSWLLFRLSKEAERLTTVLHCNTYAGQERRGQNLAFECGGSYFFLHTNDSNSGFVVVRPYIEESGI